MNKKWYWGIATLVVLLGSAFVFITIRDRAEIRKLKEDLAEAQKIYEKHNRTQNKPQHVTYSDEKPPEEPGFEWIRHGDHWDRVEIAEAHDIDTEEIVPSKNAPKCVSDIKNRLINDRRRIDSNIDIPQQFDNYDNLINLLKSDNITEQQTIKLIQSFKDYQYLVFDNGNPSTSK